MKTNLHKRTGRAISYHMEKQASNLQIVEKEISDLKPYREIEEILPPLTEDQYTRLKQDVHKDGIKVPIYITEDGRIIDGHHRWRAAKELGLKRVPVIVFEMDDEAAVSYGIRLNVNRRQLTQHQRHLLIIKLSQFAQGPGRPKKLARALTAGELARTAGVSPRTVRRVRGKFKKRLKREVVPPRRGRSVFTYEKEFEFSEIFADEIKDCASGMVAKYGNKIMSAVLKVTITRLGNPLAADQEE